MAENRKTINELISGAGDGIRTHEHLRDWTLNPAPLTWLGNPRKKGSLSLVLVVYNAIHWTVQANLRPSKYPFESLQTPATCTSPLWIC